MVGRTAELQFFILSLGAFQLTACSGVIVQLSLDRMIMSCKSRGAVLRIPFPSIKVWFSFVILRLFNRTNVNPVVVFVPVARLCEFGSFVL